MPRPMFGLPEGKFLFLTMASVHSVLERKNPLVLSRRSAAFPDHDDVGLVVKITDAHAGPTSPHSFRQPQIGCLSTSRSATLALPPLG